MHIKILAGFGLVCVSSTVGLLYKVSQATTGGFHYSTTSAVAIAEMIKLCLSVAFHLLDPSHRREGQSLLSSAYHAASEQASFCAAMHIGILAALYTFNNQLSFTIYTLADPGTIFLFKAASTAIVASIQCTFVGKRFSSDQWKAMFLQALGMVVVQYNPCSRAARYRPLAYALMTISVVVTSLCTVRNEYIVKNYAMSLNVQTGILYVFGSVLNVFAFFLLPNPNSQQAGIGFFEGYSNPLALGVIAVNALIGLAIAAVYKYADAVTKCIAADVTAVVLCVLSAAFFELEASVLVWAGVLVVCFAVYLYTTSPPPAPALEDKTDSRRLDAVPDDELDDQVAEEVALENEEDEDEVQRGYNPMPALVGRTGDEEEDEGR